jgi:hypothetical protein
MPFYVHKILIYIVYYYTVANTLPIGRQIRQSLIGIMSLRYAAGRNLFVLKQEQPSIISIDYTRTDVFQ